MCLQHFAAEERRVMRFFCFIRDEYMRDSQAFLGTLPSKNDCSDFHEMDGWKDVSGPVLVLDRNAASKTEIWNQLSNLYPGADREVFDIFAVPAVPTMELDDEYSHCRKGFSIPYEAWYAGTAVKPMEPYPFIEIGFYPENGGTLGEFKLVWEKAGMRLKAFSDSWAALYHMPELYALLLKIGASGEPSISDFASMLQQIGYVDLTEREREV